MLRLLRSTSVRLALGFAALSVASSLLLVGLLWWGTAEYLARETDAVIRADTQGIKDDVNLGGAAAAAETIAIRAGQSPDGRAVYLMAGKDLRAIGGNLLTWPDNVPVNPGWYQRPLDRGDDTRLMRFNVTELPDGLHLLVGRDVQDRTEIRSLIVDSLGWAAAAAFVIAILGGMLVRRAVLRRVEIINRAATAIVQGDLSGRLPTRDTSDEFDQLAQTINLMLRQIERLIEGVRNTSNAVAHDLRTPLAELRARLEGIIRGQEARGQPGDNAAIDEIHQAVADIDRLIGIFNALLRLSEIDSGMRRSGFRAVELAEITTEVAELYGPLIEERGIDFAVDVPVGLAVSGDPFLLAEAVGNLVDNAAKYTPRGGAISVAARHPDDAHAEITVADTGPGIDASEKSSVTARFYRGRAADGIGGVGLGLSVVEAVARLHGGALELGDNAPGLIATLRIATNLPPAPAGASPELAATG
jgi:signal transduction histidine kinase